MDLSVCARLANLAGELERDLALLLTSSAPSPRLMRIGLCLTEGTVEG